MKLVIAIIQPDQLEAVKAGLAEVEVFRMTISDVKGFGHQTIEPDSYRGHEVALNLSRKMQVMIAVNDEFVEPTVTAIKKSARTGQDGQSGDGVIFVSQLEDCIRIRTGERGGEAI